jgi:hypothetical protein
MKMHGATVKTIFQINVNKTFLNTQVIFRY